MNAKDLQQRINTFYQELVDATDKARTSDLMRKYLDFSAKFHAYSANNIWLIQLTRPDATYVAGYQKWKTMGRWVCKGEQGIPIFAPLIHKEKEADGQEIHSLTGFKVVFVFDVQQTEGQPLPPMPDWKSPKQIEELNQRLIKFAEAQGVSVTFKDLGGDIQGVSKGGEIEVDQRAGTKTLIHELAHELMHQGKSGLQSRDLKELEAESVAYVVSKHFEIPELNCPNYLALYGIEKDRMVEHLKRIQKTAGEIISVLESPTEKAILAIAFQA